MNLDPCCYLCRSATGVCLTRNRCDHHIEAIRKQAAEDNHRPPYRDPTGEAATRNVMRERRHK